MKFIRSIYLHKQFFIYLALAAVCFLISYWFPLLYSIAWIFTVTLTVLLVFDLMLLYSNKDGLLANRLLPDKFSNSDDNPVPISIQNNYAYTLYLRVIDELPVQFQKRDFLHQARVAGKNVYNFDYFVRPVERGEYAFGKLNVYASTMLKIVMRRYTFEANQNVSVYPSFIQMQKYDFLAMDNKLTEIGLKKIRRIGHTTEFEQIKDYVPGDDFRTINWKATAKRANLMVNQYQDEKSQPVFSVIDTGRMMKMPFEGLKLLDYAINSALAFSNVALKKHDKVGLISFSKAIETFVPAMQKRTHLNTLMESLYKIDTQFNDSDFGLLYGQTKRKVTHRSLLMLYTNFEHISALRRQLPYLQSLSKKHLLVVIFFENTELDVLITSKSENLQDLYHKTIAEKFAYEKRLMVKELRKHGIQSILTTPENLTVNAINKYLEIKARGLL